MTMPITEHAVRTGEHVTAYLACGPEDGPLVVFVHGWPELSSSWRHQLPVLGALGFRAIAPDMRGYGRSSVYARHENYAQPLVVADMLALIDHLGRERAVWVGHDWGCATVWNLASLHKERCHAVANLCVPYATLERGLDACLHLIDRDIYPVEDFPAGQWEYQRFYEENFDRATGVMDAGPTNVAKALFRKGKSEGQGKPAVTAFARQHGGWFGGVDVPPDLPRDSDVISQVDLATYGSALLRNGFFGPNSYYMNHAENAHFATQIRGDDHLHLPVLFLAARYDYTCESVRSRLADPMRERCTDLTEAVIDCGHWMAQEAPVKVNGLLVGWLRAQAKYWPGASHHS
ncbi:MAG: pimeloyl-ACP methyl ester carboxylesterase [Gammaproteobacteria bacterium]|jgi:pimeloyl-ACP methyl ester carboxylesterase